MSPFTNCCSRCFTFTGAIWGRPHIIFTIVHRVRWGEGVNGHRTLLSNMFYVGLPMVSFVNIVLPLPRRQLN